MREKACTKSTIRISNLKFEIWRKSKEKYNFVFLDAVAVADVVTATYLKHSVAHRKQSSIA